MIAIMNCIIKKYTIYAIQQKYYSYTTNNGPDRKKVLFLPRPQGQNVVRNHLIIKGIRKATTCFPSKGKHSGVILCK